MTRRIRSWMELWLRIKPVPALFISVYIFLVYNAVTWYMTLVAPTMEQTTFVGAIIGVGAAWFGIYGRIIDNSDDQENKYQSNHTHDAVESIEDPADSKPTEK